MDELVKDGYNGYLFNDINEDFNKHDFGNKKYDIIIDISAIEHFGLLAYTNTERDDDADKKAIALISMIMSYFLFPKSCLLKSSGMKLKFGC